jgi:hypothetical protein
MVESANSFPSEHRIHIGKRASPVLAAKIPPYAMGEPISGGLQGRPPV